MKTVTAREAKTHFGELLDAMQREPVIVTKKDPLPDATERDGEKDKLKTYFSEAAGLGG